MFLGKYYVTDHAIERYCERINFKGSPIDAIKKDLRTLNIKNIVYNDKKIHVFTKNSKEFIFIKIKNKLCLVTVIKRNIEENKKYIKFRKSQ